MTDESKPFASWPLCKKLVAEHYAAAAGANRSGQPLVWAGVAAPHEIFRAMDVTGIWGETYGAVCGGTHQLELNEVVDNAGYSRNICGYSRMTIGSMLSDKGPIGPFPRPTVVVCSNHACQAQIKWWEQVARHFDVPMFVLDVPPVYGELEEHHVSYVQAQFHDLKDFLERELHRRLDEERLIESWTWGHRLTQLWDEVMEYLKAEPCPVSFRTIYNFFVPVIALRGVPAALGVYEQLREELAERVATGSRVVPEERIRLLWEGFPMWHRLEIVRWMEERGVVLVNNSYVMMWAAAHRRFPNQDLPGSPAQSWRPPKNEDEVFRQMAVHALGVMLNRGTRFRADYTLQLLREWRADAIVSNAHRGCKLFALGQLDSQTAFAQELGIPTLVFEANVTDPRDYSDAATKNRLEVFFERVMATTNKR